MITSFILITGLKSEFIILIDRSGSMQGNSINLAKEALVVKFFMGNCNICGFKLKLIDMSICSYSSTHFQRIVTSM